MPRENPPCSPQGKCEGALVPIDSKVIGEENELRLRCSKYQRVTYFKMTVQQFFELLELRDEMDKINK